MAQFEIIFAPDQVIQSIVWLIELKNRNPKGLAKDYLRDDNRQNAIITEDPTSLKPKEKSEIRNNKKKKNPT